MTLHDMIQLIKSHFDNEEMLYSLYSSLSQDDFDYVYSAFITNDATTDNPIQKTLSEYRKRDNAIEMPNRLRNTSAMGFGKILNKLSSTSTYDAVSVINDPLLATVHQQLQCSLQKIMAVKESKNKISTSTVASLDTSNQLLSTYLHKDIVYAMVLHHQPELYKSLPSQVAQYITREAVDAAYVSYFEVKKSNFKAKPPSYLKKNGFYPMNWATTTFKVVADSKGRPYMRLSLGNSHFEGYKNALQSVDESTCILGTSKYAAEINRKSKTVQYKSRRGCIQDPAATKSDGNDTIGTQYLRYRCGTSLRDTKLAQVRIVPKRQGSIFEIQYVKSLPVTPLANAIPSRIMAIDFGVVNVVTAVTNVPGLRPWIIGGRELVHLNKRFESAISAKQKTLEVKHSVKQSHSLHHLW